MEQDDFLKKLQAKLKIKAAEDLELVLDDLLSLLHPTSPLMNEWVQVKGRYSQVESETVKGILSYDQRTLQLNRIRENLLELLDRIAIADLNREHSAEVAEYLDQFAENSTPLTESKSAETAPSELSEIKKITLDDLEILTETHRSTLTCFPKVYRSARSVLVRGNKSDERIAPYFQTITKNLETLEKFVKLISPIEKKIKQIRLNREHQGYWLRFRKFKNWAADVELEGLDKVGANIEELQELHDEMLERYLI